MVRAFLVCGRGQLCGNYLGHRTLHLTLTSPIRLQRNHHHDEDDLYDGHHEEDDADDDGDDQNCLVKLLCQQ